MYSNDVDRDKDIEIVKETIIKLVNGLFECENGSSKQSKGLERINVEFKATDILKKMVDLSNKKIFKSFQLNLSMEF